jgi:hypothetical protein
VVVAESVGLAVELMTTERWSRRSSMAAAAAVSVTALTEFPH